MITIKHLRKEYPNATPLKDVNAEIKKGEVIAIIGPSGTGKSTLLRCINRLETPTSGEIWVDGVNVCDPKTDLSKVRQKMGMVFQSFNLFAHKTVLENVMMAPVDLLHMDKKEAEKEALRLLGLVGLDSKADNFPDILSGGQKQRVAIARTLAMKPEIILFDEPTSALDPAMVSEVLAVITSLAKQGMTMMIVTHEMRFAREVSTRIFYMDEGLIYEDAPPKQIFENPQKERTRNFIFRIKSWQYDISEYNFDSYQMLGSLEAFASRQFLTRKQIQRLRLVFEELISGRFMRAADSEDGLDAPILKLSFSCGENGVKPVLQIEYSGLTGNPFSHDYDDDLRDTIVNRTTRIISQDEEAKNIRYELILE